MAASVLTVNFFTANFFTASFFTASFFTGSAAASEHLSDHEVFCRQPQPSCEQQLQKALQGAPVHSSQWHKLQSYLLDFYYDKHRFAELRQLAEQLLSQTDNPPVLQAQLNFYYAKVLLSSGERDKAKTYAAQASEKLTLLFDVFGDPLRLVELANLQYSLNQRDQMEQTLLLAESRFAKSRDPLFVFELNTNKALLAHSRNQLTYAALYRQRALDAILPTGHSGKISTALGNLARTEQLQGQYLAAIAHYQQSLPYLTGASDNTIRAIHLLRLAELFNQIKDPSQVHHHLQQVDPALLRSEVHQQLYQQLSTGAGQAVRE